MLPFIAGGFLGVQQTIEVMAEFLGEHRDPLLLTGLLQPIRIQVDGARGAAIGACRGGHGAFRQQPDRGQGRKISLGPMTGEGLELGRLLLQLQGLLGRGLEAAIGGPAPQLLLPGHQERDGRGSHNNSFFYR